VTRYSNVIEADAERALLAGIRQRRGLCFKLKFLGLAGAPDRLVLLPGGRLYFVEVKQPSGKLEASQQTLFPRLEALGFTVHVLYGVEAVQQFLAAIPPE
jgi:hypothetical protein